MDGYFFVSLRLFEYDANFLPTHRERCTFFSTIILGQLHSFWRLFCPSDVEEESS